MVNRRPSAVNAVEVAQLDEGKRTAAGARPQTPGVLRSLSAALASVMASVPVSMLLLEAPTISMYCRSKADAGGVGDGDLGDAVGVFVLAVAVENPHHVANRLGWDARCRELDDVDRAEGAEAVPVRWGAQGENEARAVPLWKRRSHPI